MGLWSAQLEGTEGQVFTPITLTTSQAEPWVPKHFFIFLNSNSRMDGSVNIDEKFLIKS